MKEVITSEKAIIKSWVTDLESGALAQATNMANLPFVFKHIALMPDCHQGYGMPIGGVLATKDVVIPNAVGVDIGCGMCAIRTDVKEISKHGLIEIRDRISELVPVGFNHQKEAQNVMYMPNGNGDGISSFTIISDQFGSALHQLGTLGGGNHFIEIQKGSDGFVWIMIHSGSRNLGYKVAKHYNDLAKKLNEKWFSEVKKETDLAFLPINTKEAKDYMLEMQYCVDFALSNRTLMMDQVMKAFFEIFPSVKFDGFINIAHNYARWENHYGKNVIVHRKGATSARKGEFGIIPGSQGTKSYIVKGLGNKESFMSCSHGAGRRMGRKQAQRELNLESELAAMEKLGVIHGMESENDLDEAAGAYKDIGAVMENQKDLVEIVIELKPLAVIKG